MRRFLRKNEGRNSPAGRRGLHSTETAQEESALNDAPPLRAFLRCLLVFVGGERRGVRLVLFLLWGARACAGSFAEGACSRPLPAPSGARVRCFLWCQNSTILPSSRWNGQASPYGSGKREGRERAREIERTSWIHLRMRGRSPPCASQYCLAGRAGSDSVLSRVADRVGCQVRVLCACSTPSLFRTAGVHLASKRWGRARESGRGRESGNTCASVLPSFLVSLSLSLRCSAETYYGSNGALAVRSSLQCSPRNGTLPLAPPPAQ